MSENIAIAHLAECESDASYVRKRKMTSFTSVSSEPKKSHLCQIPSDKELEVRVRVIKGYLGEPCAPYSIYHYKWVDGNLGKCDYQVYGCKMNCDYTYIKNCLKT